MLQPLFRLFGLIALSLTLGAAKPAAPVSTALAPAAPSVTTGETDDIGATERSVVRVVTVAIVNGEVVGFGHGSGFAVSPTRVVTNAHVVADAAEFPQNVVIGIVPSEGSRSYPGRLVRLDRRRDLAIVEIEQGRLPPVSIYTGPVAQRQNVFALGYPGNVDVATAQSMDDFIRPRAPVASDGIVSASDSINGVSALVHDADIARGNSGGPLVDQCGRVLGVNSFISRADEGDSPFGFAVSVRELAQFLQDAGQRFTGVATACLTPAQARARADAADAATRAAADAAHARTEAAQAARAQELERLRAKTQSRRETWMAMAAALLGGAVLAGVASFAYQVQNKPRERRAALLAAGLLGFAAIMVFLLRPNPADVRLPDEELAAEPAEQVAALTGSMVCTVDPTRGRITVSAGEDTSFTFSPTGCVNGRTQYSPGGDGVWSRTLVPNQDATVTRISYDPTRGETVTRRYLLRLDAMEAARRQRASIEVNGCTADPAQLAALTARENALAALLPADPNEEIISRCRPASGEATQ